MMLAIGLFAVPRADRAPGRCARCPGRACARCRPRSSCALAVALVSVPIYLIVSTAKFALRSGSDLGTLIPLVRDSSFGRSFLDLWILLALFGVAALRRDRDRPPDASGALGRRAARDAARRSRRGARARDPGHRAGTRRRRRRAALALGLDWVHLVSGSLWLGGLAGLLVLWFSTPPGRRRATLALVVPALLEGGVRLGDGAARVGRRRLVPAPPDVRERCGTRATARRSSSRRRCSRSRCCSAPSTCS